MKKNLQKLESNKSIKNKDKYKKKLQVWRWRRSMCVEIKSFPLFSISIFFFLEAEQKESFLIFMAITCVITTTNNNRTINKEGKIFTCFPPFSHYIHLYMDCPVFSFLPIALHHLHRTPVLAVDHYFLPLLVNSPI
jgi:hypothetical protein